MTEPGRKFGKYEIVAELGRGGFATVHRAHDTTLERDVALKILAPHLSWDLDFAKRFRQEAIVVARLNHPHIVTIHEVGEFEGMLYIAMELIEGGTLRAQLQANGAMNAERVVGYLSGIADALDYAHTQGLIHRDVKPANILLNTVYGERIWPVLTDFGLVKALAHSSALTTTGTVLGSAEYMAPEQADARRRDEVGPATDIYALGVVAYHMLTGRVPFSGSTIEVLMAHTTQAPLRPSDIRSDISEPVSGVILKALAKSPADRYPTARAFVDALQAAAMSPAPSPPDPVVALLPAAPRHPETVAAATPAAAVIPAPAETATPAPFSPPGVTSKPVGKGPRRWLILAALLALAAVALLVVVGGNTLRSLRTSGSSGSPGVGNVLLPTSTPRPQATATTEALAMQATATDRPTATTLVEIATKTPATASVSAPTPVVQAVVATATSAPTAVPRATATATRQPTATTLPTATAAPDAVVRVASLNMRSGPGTAYGILASYRQGVVLDVIGRNQDGSWLQVVTPDGRTGWMIASSLVINLSVPLGGGGGSAGLAHAGAHRHGRA